MWHLDGDRLEDDREILLMLGWVFHSEEESRVEFPAEDQADHPEEQEVKE